MEIGHDCVKLETKRQLLRLQDCIKYIEKKELPKLYFKA